MKTNLVCGLMSLAFASSAFAAKISMQTRGGKLFSLETNQDRVTGETREMTLCGESVELIKKVKLWMPEHGHGSSPVQLEAMADGCRVVKRVNFTMTGAWEVRVELTDDDSGAFVVEVE